MRQRDAFNEICEIHGGLRAMHSNCGNLIPDDLHCAECGTLTNHTTAQHEEAMADTLCHECGINQRMDDDPETRVCRACYDEQVAAYMPETGREYAQRIKERDDAEDAAWRAADNYDTQAKEAN